MICDLQLFLLKQSAAKKCALFLISVASQCDTAAGAYCEKTFCFIIFYIFLYCLYFFKSRHSCIIWSVQSFSIWCLNNRNGRSFSVTKYISIKMHLVGLRSVSPLPGFYLELGVILHKWLLGQCWLLEILTWIKVNSYHFGWLHRKKCIM